MMTVTSLPASAAASSASTIGGLIAGAVERLLDREHARVAGGLAQEVHDRSEAAVRMMQQQVALADDREQIGGADQSRRQPGREGRILEIGALRQIVDRREAVQIHRPRHLVAIQRRERELRAAGTRPCPAGQSAAVSSRTAAP